MYRKERVGLDIYTSVASGNSCEWWGPLGLCLWREYKLLHYSFISEAGKQKTCLCPASGTSYTVCTDGGSCYLFLLWSFAAEAFLRVFSQQCTFHLNTVVSWKLFFFFPTCSLKGNDPHCAELIFLLFFFFPSLFPFKLLSASFFPHFSSSL